MIRVRGKTRSANLASNSRGHSTTHCKKPSLKYRWMNRNYERRSELAFAFRFKPIGTNLYLTYLKQSTRTYVSSLQSTTDFMQQVPNQHVFTVFRKKTSKNTPRMAGC